MEGVHGAAEVSCLGDSYDGGRVKEDEAVLLCSRKKSLYRSHRHAFSAEGWIFGVVDSFPEAGSAVNIL